MKSKINLILTANEFDVCIEGFRFRKSRYENIYVTTPEGVKIFADQIDIRIYTDVNSGTLNTHVEFIMKMEGECIGTFTIPYPINEREDIIYTTDIRKLGEYVDNVSYVFATTDYNQELHYDLDNNRRLSFKKYETGFVKVTFYIDSHPLSEIFGVELLCTERHISEEGGKGLRICVKSLDKTICLMQFWGEHSYVTEA